MGITFNGSTSKLVLTGMVEMVTAYPFTLVWWMKPTSGASNQGIFMHGDGSNTEFIRSVISSSAGKIRGSASGNSTDSVAAPDTANWKLGMYVGTNATNRVQYYSAIGGDSTDTVSATPTFANFDQVWIGMLPGDVFPFGGDIAECHIFSTALTTTDFGNLAADSVKPEAVTGWVDGWKLTTATDLTSIGGTRTLTATSVTSAANHPITRSGGASSVPSRNLSLLGVG